MNIPEKISLTQPQEEKTHAKHRKHPDDHQELKGQKKKRKAQKPEFDSLSFDIGICSSQFLLMY